MTKPAILFVSGAWHEPDYFQPVAQRLEAAGYQTYSVRLATNTFKAKEFRNFDPDVAAVRAKLQNIIEKDQTVLVVMHSYGSIPACEAVKDLDLQTRLQNGQKGGVSRLFFVAFLLLPEGQSLLHSFGGNILPCFDVSEDKLEAKVINAPKVFCQGMTEEQEKWTLQSLVPHSYQTFLSPVTFAAWKVIPSTYLYCLRNVAIPLAVQRLMVEETGVAYTIAIDQVDTAHIPFITKPDETALAVRRAAGEKV